MRHNIFAKLKYLLAIFPSLSSPLQDGLPRPNVKRSVYFIGYSQRCIRSRNSLNNRSTTGPALLGRVPNGILGRVGASLKWVIAAEWSARYLRCTSSIARLQPFPKRPYALWTKVYCARDEHACLYLRGKSSRNIVVE